MNTILLAGIGLIWSAISGAIGSVITWEVKERRYRRQRIAIAADAAKLSIGLTEAQKLIARLNADYETLRQERDRLKADYAALQVLHKAQIVHTDDLVAQITDRDEAIATLTAQLAAPAKRLRAPKIKAAD